MLFLQHSFYQKSWIELTQYSDWFIAMFYKFGDFSILRSSFLNSQMKYSSSLRIIETLTISALFTQFISITLCEFVFITILKFRYGNFIVANLFLF